MREFKFRMFDTEEKQFMNGSRVIESRINDLNKQGRWIYQQWTGLKDDKGNDIYEGDIVKLHDRVLGFTVGTRIGVVAFENGSFVIKNDFSTNYRWIDYDLEVLGNIFENPELLGS